MLPDDVSGQICFDGLSIIEDQMAAVARLNVDGHSWERVGYREEWDLTPIEFTEWPLDFSATRLHPQRMARYRVDAYNWARAMHPIPVAADRKAFEAAVLANLGLMCCDHPDSAFSKEEIAAREIVLCGVPMEEILDYLFLPLGDARERWKREYYDSLYMHVEHVADTPSPLYRAWLDLAQSSYLGYLRVRNIDGAYAASCVFSLCTEKRDHVVVDEELLNLTTEATIIAHDVLTYPKHKSEHEVFSLVRYTGEDALEGLYYRAGNIANRVCALTLDRGVGDGYRAFIWGLYAVRANNARYEFAKPWANACRIEVPLSSTWHRQPDAMQIVHTDPS
ncbi:hypothetical protein [Streptomyces sp. NPDC050485]|uniref:hypothetical protein n=1 Tax=Streptomyces sp. NPDC050485 TaxID=3365617 RepID=UPI0037A865FA